MTQNLIAVSSRIIGNESVNAVDARELHAFLEVGKKFTDWIKDRIEQYGFAEHFDYEVYEDLSVPNLGSSKSRPQKTKEYALTLDMAKELCMVERTAKGKEARQYFIECERRLLEREPAAAPAIETKSSKAVTVLGFAYDMLLRIPGVNQELAYAQLTTLLTKETGVDATPLQKTLPARDEKVFDKNATQIGDILGLSARKTNSVIEACGLQFKNSRNEWELTEKGRKYGEMKPFMRGGHAGYQILWHEDVAKYIYDDYLCWGDYALPEQD